MIDSPSINQVRLVIKFGSLILGISALTLLIFPNFFTKLLGFTTTSELEWAMRMIGITLFALTGNMFSISTRGTAQSIIFSGKVMLVSAFSLAVLTLLIPTNLNWFTIGYSLVGFGFSVAYAFTLIKK